MAQHKKKDRSTDRLQPEQTSSSSPSSSSPPSSSPPSPPSPTPPAPATAPVASPGPVTPTEPTPIPHDVLGRLRSGTHHDPHSVYGAHRDGDGSVVRTVQPGAVEV